ncbi:uncharacterized protein LOC121379459 [Gigantopelta aegis]|uniref:uncharacterized protein LOC121379459 n=1 Tax=Gigantopelta aegis TaxID=1735272 RepID=UPI001B88A341|nr:uncharacterized protein LOC121379459 [Gigantopelta aegis]
MFSKNSFMLLAVGILLLNKGIGAAELTGVTITGHDDGYVAMEDGSCTACKATINVDYAQSLPGFIFFAADSGNLIEKPISQGSSSYEIASTSFSGPGTYWVNITVTLGSDIYTLPLTFIVETQLVGFQADISSGYLIPNEEFALTAAVNSGTNVLFTVDLEQNIRMLKSCDGNNLQTNVTYSYNETGTYNLAVMASNYISNSSSNMIVLVMYKPNGFTVTQTSPSTLQTTEDTVFKIDLDSNALVSMGNVTIFLSCDNGSNTSTPLTISPGGSQNVPWTFSIQGNYTIEVQITNAVGSVSNTFNIYVWDRLNISLCLPNSYVAVNEEVSFFIDGLPPSGFLYKIDFGNGIVRENSDEDILYSSYSPIDLTGVNYTEPGNYTVHFEAQNQRYAVVRDFELIALVGIDELIVEWGNATVAVGSTYMVTVNVTQGTDVLVGINFHETFAMNKDCNYLQAEHIFNTVGNYTINVFASNPAGNKSETFDVEVVYDLNGLTIDVEKPFLQTTESASFIVNLDPTANVSMGTLTINIMPCDTSNFTGALIISPGNFKTFPCTFTIQGNYSVTVTILSPLGTELSKTVDIYVWDVLNVTLSVDEFNFKVGYNPVFQINDPPPSGFLYAIDFAESTTLNQIDPAILASPYSNIILPSSFNYNAPGQYVVTFKAFNDFYMIFRNLCLNVQYGIPDSYLQVNPKRTYVIPDDIATYIIFSNSNSTAPKPTNVTCDINYGDGTVLTNDSTEFDYDDTGLGLRLEHSYTAAGTYEVILNCSNLVSSLVLTTTIHAIVVTADTFNVSYSSVNLHNESQSGLLQVELQLYDLTTPPNGVSLLWDFADGSTPEEVNPMVSFSKQHTYSNRGNYSGSVKITYAGVAATKSFDVRMGAFVITMVTAEDVGLVSEKQFNFEITKYLTATSANVDVSWGDGTTDTFVFSQSLSQKSVNHVFALGGVFAPQIQVSTDNGIEYSSIQNFITIQNVVQNITWPVSSNAVLLRPFAPKLVYNGDAFLIHLTCYFNYDDVNMTSENVNFTSDAPEVIAPTYTYETQGERSISVTCSNIFTSQTLTATIQVFSDCFNSGTMFETTYRSVNTPLKAFMSSIPAISGRVELTAKCQNSTDITYTWTVEEQDITDPTVWRKLNVLTPNANVYDLAISSIGPGTFRLTCNLTVVATKLESIEDFMYVELINPPLVVELTGGTQRVVGKNVVISLDAVSNSYDPVIGYGKENHLSFSWNCYQVVENDLDSYFVPHSTDTTYRAKSSCNILVPSDGVISVLASSLVLDGWSIFEANITKDTRAAVAIQAIKVVEVSPPQITLTCKWNCEFKKSRGSRMVYETDVTCPDCSASQLASGAYEWTLYKYSGNSYDIVDNIDSHFLSASSAKMFDLDGDFMEQGSSYKLKVTFIVGNIAPGSSEVTFVVNEEPYGGTCIVSPTTGTATIAAFSFSCSGWKDEGNRRSRDPAQDKSEPLTYVFKQVNGNEKQLIYSGNEASAIQTIEVCPKDDGYVCLIEFKIKDAFKAETIVVFNITVTNPIPDIQFNTFGGSDTGNKSDDAAAAEFTSFMEKTMTTMVTMSRTNDAEKTIKVATSYMSAINTVTIRQITGDDILNTSKSMEVNDIVEDALDRFTTEDPQTTILLQTTEVVTNTMLVSINTLAVKPFNSDARNNSDGNMLHNSVPEPDLLIMLSTSLATALKIPSVVKANVVSNSAGGITTLSNVFVNLLNNTRDMDVVESAIEAIGTAQSNLNKNVAELVIEDYLEDLHGMERFVSRELNEGEKRFNAIERKYIRKVAQKKKKVKRQKMLKNIREIQENFKTTTDNMLLLMDKVMPDGTSKTVDTDNFALTLEKKTVKDLVESKREPINGANFGLSGISDNLLGNNEIVKLYVKVMKKNIYIQGDNAKYIDGPVTVASARMKDGATLTITEPLIKQTDPVDAPRQIIFPKFIPGDAAKLFYHSFFYRSLHADICFSALPITDVKIVYDMYFRSILPPTDMEYDHYTYYTVAPGVSGTKFCVPAGALKRTGVAYVGLRPRLNEAVAVSRKKRSVSNNATTTDSDLETPYLFRLTTITCFSWDGQVQDWRSTICELKRDDTNNETTCICPSTQEVIVSVSFFVPPNSIDFSTVFSKFDVSGQAAILSTLVLIFTLFVIAALFSRYKDGQDVLQWGVSLLEDNFSEDCYFYLITVYTGMIRQGGTRSKIEFNITGEEGDTGIRVLTDGVRKEFGAGSVLHFIMAVPLPLGHLQCLRVWHDNAGKGSWASWYLNRIEVIDLQTAERFDFLCYKWLSFEAGKIEAILGVGSSENMKNFKTMFFEHARVHVTDDHLWLSTVLRPVKSHFSRVQRVGCCLAFLLLSMISNAMFFKGKDFKDRKQVADFELGPFKFSLSQLWISFVSALITAIPVFVMMLLFRKSKLSKSQLSTDEYTTHWMLPCFKRFKFYKDSVSLQKVLVIKDIVDDEEGVLPHFCVYIAWVIVVLASLVPAFFVFLYTIQWGKEISEQFLITFFLSFAESMFILDPFKIVFLAIIFAIILKNIKVVRPTVF